MADTPPNAYVTTLKKHGFDLGERLGSGAYGTVYRAEQGKLGRPVAVKFFDKLTARFAANRIRFDREAPLLARVQHRAVPYVITTGTVKGADTDVPYTVMQFVEGPTLEKKIEAGKLPIPLVRLVMHDILSALERAHRLKVIHRDVKPDNIIVSEQGIYLIDFSLGFCVDIDAGLDRATVAGERIGTWLYAAPEQLKDAASVTYRADLYSAGAVLAEMLGIRPRVRHDRLDVELPDHSQAIRDMIRKATAEDPSQRFESAAAFQAAAEAAFGPTGAEWLEKRLVLCPNPRCTAATWSNGEKRSYYWGPKVIGPTRDRHCESCGAEYLRGCPNCQQPVPGNIASLVGKSIKTADDALEAFCSGCGTSIFRTPTCKKCNSYLTKTDLGKDTNEGCQKCKRPPKPLGYTGYGGGAGTVTDPAPPATDDDIPF